MTHFPTEYRVAQDGQVHKYVMEVEFLCGNELNQHLEAVLNDYCGPYWQGALDSDHAEQ